VRRILLFAAAGLAPALWLANAPAAELEVGTPGGAPVVTPVKVVKPAPAAETCGEFGTTVHFEKNPSDAAQKAAKEKKLVFVLHVSGNFETPDFT